MSVRFHRLLTLILMVLALISALALTHVVRNPAELRRLSLDDDAGLPPLPGLLTGNPGQYFALPKLEHFAETVERPLFSDTRRPPPPEKAKPKPVAEVIPEPEDPKFTLIGVMSMPEADVVLLQDEAGKVSRLRRGDSIDSWQVDIVDADQIVLRNGERTQEVPLLRNQTRGAGMTKAPLAPEKANINDVPQVSPQVSEDVIRARQARRRQILEEARARAAQRQQRMQSQ